MGWIREWWAQPDHYRWLSGYLGYRNLLRFTGRMMAAIVALLGAVPLMTLWTQEGPHTAAGRAIAVLVSVCCAMMSVLWLTRWPSRRQSVLFVVTANFCIAASCLIYSSPQVALLGCTAFAALAGYVAFFHTSRYLALVLGTGAATSVVCAIRLAAEAGALIAAAELLIIGVAALAVPFSLHVVIHLLGDEALKSHTDPLTGLRNRRGFHRSARDLMSAADTAPYFSLIMLDLDRFKQVNDTRGHATGDRILVAVADRLRHTAGGRAVIGRVGGEEFLIAEMTESVEAQAIAERLRREVAAIPWGVTASVGVASIRRVDIDGADYRAVIERLVNAADAAMYAAKRAGGNRTQLADSIEIHSR